MDRIKDSGSFDKGSIPLGCTIKQPQQAQFQYFTLPIILTNHTKCVLNIIKKTTIEV